MPCYYPVKGFRAVAGGISWTPSVSYVDQEVQVPCGQCIGCRLERARQWSVRLMHEASLHQDNCFVTLTYDDEHLPDKGCLRIRDFQLFMKRLRKRASTRISFFHCGEYGELNGRPHYHAILFGVDWPDRVKYGRNERGDMLFSSKLLDSIWQNGFAWSGSVTRESCGYVARYCLKKVTGDRADEHYKRVDPETGEIYWLPPEYASMSLRPAIGKGWFDKFAGDVVAYDGVVNAGVMQRPPRYYDKLRGREVMKSVKRERVYKALEHAADQTPDRLRVREEVKRAALRSLKRNL